MWFISKRRKHLIKLRTFLNGLEKNKDRFYEGYLEQREVEVNMLQWLIAHYEGRTSVGSPEEYLEALLEKNSRNVFLTDESLRGVRFLWYWINGNKITGF